MLTPDKNKILRPDHRKVIAEGASRSGKSAKFIDLLVTKGYTREEARKLLASVEATNVGATRSGKLTALMQKEKDLRDGKK